MRAAAAAEAGRADRTAADAFVWKISATSGLISFDFAATNHRWGGGGDENWLEFKLEMSSVIPSSPWLAKTGVTLFN